MHVQSGAQPKPWRHPAASFQSLPSVQLPPHAYGVLHVLAAVAFPNTCDMCLLTTGLCLWSCLLPHSLDAL